MGDGGKMFRAIINYINHFIGLKIIFFDKIVSQNR